MSTRLEHLNSTLISGGGKEGRGTSLCEKYVERKRIKHVLSRKNNPQTNGKLERWFQEYIKHRERFETPEEFRNWYNKRIHGALNLEIGETSEEAFIKAKTRISVWNVLEEDGGLIKMETHID